MRIGVRRGPLPPALAPWLELERLEYQALDEQWAIVRLLAGIDHELRVPPGTTLLVARGNLETHYRPLVNVTERREQGPRASELGLLWRASFGIPLHVVEYPQALFSVAAADGIRLALPTPSRLRTEAEADAEAIPELTGHVFERRAPHRQARRHLVALASGFAVAAASGSAVAVADSVTTTSTTSSTQSAPQTTDTTQTTTDTSSTTPSSSPDTTSSSVSTTAAPDPPTPPPAPVQSSAPAASTVISSTAPTVTSKSSPGSAPSSSHHTGTHHAQLQCKAPTVLLTDQLAKKEHWPLPQPGAKPKCVLVPAAPKHKTKHHRKHKGNKGGNTFGSGVLSSRSRLSGGAGIAPKPAPKPKSDLGAQTAAFNATTSALALSSTGEFLDPFTAAEIKQFSSSIGSVNQPPKWLVRIYKAAGRRYHVPWQILGAINAIESDYGRNLSVSSAGAIGWMQFMPGTWLEYAVQARKNKTPNPYNPRDAIFTAARYLRASGAPKHMRKAIFAYNHALWYVDAVLWRAQLISDHSLKFRHRKHGYALPLDKRYMRELGRIDDGVDIEKAPNGAAVYSMTPGIVTAVASNPSGFGPNYPVVQVTKGPLAGQFIYYGHVLQSLVHPGQHVIAGQPIAVMGHTGDAASLGHGHIEIGFSDASGTPLNQHGGASAWTPSGDAMRHVLVALWQAYTAKSPPRSHAKPSHSHAKPSHPSGRSPHRPNGGWRFIHPG